MQNWFSLLLINNSVIDLISKDSLILKNIQDELDSSIFQLQALIEDYIPSFGLSSQLNLNSILKTDKNTNPDIISSEEVEYNEGSIPFKNKYIG
jgi:hypothetical protein